MRLRTRPPLLTYLLTLWPRILVLALLQPHWWSLLVLLPSPLASAPFPVLPCPPSPVPSFLFFSRSTLPPSALRRSLPLFYPLSIPLLFQAARPPPATGPDHPPPVLVLPLRFPVPPHPRPRRGTSFVLPFPSAIPSTYFAPPPSGSSSTSRHCFRSPSTSLLALASAPLLPPPPPHPEVLSTSAGPFPCCCSPNQAPTRSVP